MAGVGVPDGQPLVVVHEDGVARCGWAAGAALVAYHDVEWGTPTREAAALFEALSLTVFENGLSWTLVFGRREALRVAFRGFEPAVVAGLEVDEVISRDGVIRNRRKVAAVIQNARCAVDGALARLVWEDGPVVHAPMRRWSEGRSRSAESVRLAGRLKTVGFRLIGPVVAHSFMQGVGVDNGHVAGCFRAPAGQSGGPR